MLFVLLLEFLTTNTVQTLFHKRIAPDTRPAGSSRPSDPLHRRLFLPLAVFLVVATGLAGASYRYFLHEREAIVRDIGAHLSTIAETKVSQVTAWREERFKDARAIAAQAASPSAVRALEGSGEEAAAAVRQWIQGPKAAVYANAVLVGREGDVHVALGAARAPEVYIALAEQARRAGGVVLADLERSQSGEVLDLGLIIPLAAGRPTYLNPVLGGDHPYAGAIRVGDEFYLTHSSFDYAPGLPIWHSKDLVNWTQVGAALKKYYGSVWAPYLCEHEGRFFIYFPCNNRLHVVHAQDARGPWSEPVDLKIEAI